MLLAGLQPEIILSCLQGTQVAMVSGRISPLPAVPLDLPLFSKLAQTWRNFPDWGASVGEVYLLLMF